MALALYRKYRPRTFAEVIGQEHVTEPLSQALRSGRLHHAYLFSGPRGCGKTSSARILARSLNCERGPTPEPCGQCASCRSLANDGGGSIDVIEIDAASHGGVDDARDLREKAFFAPASSRYKIYVIDEAHMVSSAGFNALLKLVEEPPDYVKFIFATTEPEKVLGTIRSRTHHYPFRLIPPATLRPYLEQLTAAEGVKVDPAVFPLVVRAGGGSARDTLSVLDQLIAGAGPDGVDYRRAVTLLGVTDVALIDEMCDALAAGDGAAAYATIDRVAQAGHDARRFASDLLERLRDLIVMQQVPDAVAKGLIDGPADQVERMTGQATRLGPATLSRCADIVHDGLVEMRGTTAPRLLLELIAARMLLPGAQDATSALLQRLERMERRLTLQDHQVRPAVAPAASQTPAALDRPASAAPNGEGGPAAGRFGGGPSAERSNPGVDMTAGHGGDAIAGHGGDVTAGHGGDVTAGHGGDVTAGHGGDAVARDPSKGHDAARRGAPSWAEHDSAAQAAGTRAAGDQEAGGQAIGQQPVGGLAAAASARHDADVRSQTTPSGYSADGSVAVGSGSAGSTAAGSAAGGPVGGGSAGGPAWGGAGGAVAESAAGGTAPPRQPSSPAVIPDPPANDIDPGVAVPGQLSAASVRETWPDIVAMVGRKSKKIAALAHGATVRDLEGQTVVLTFRFPAHARMVSDQPDLLVEALYEALGGRWQIRCEVSGAAGAATPSRPAAPVQPQSAPLRPAAPPVSPPPAAAMSGDDWPEPARLGGPSAAPQNPAASVGPTDGGRAGAGPAGGAAADGAAAGGAAAGGAAAGGGSFGGGHPGGGAVNGGGGAVNGDGRAAGAGRDGGSVTAADGVAQSAAGGSARTPSEAVQAARAAAARAGTTWPDGSPAEEPPYDPEYDGPGGGAKPAAPAQGRPEAQYEGFDPGDVPLDVVVDEKTARQSSEQQAVQLLRDAFGAERIGGDA